MSEDLIIDIWNSLKEYLDKKQIETAASRFVDTLVDNGIDDNTLRSALGGDEYLDEAIEYYFDEFEEEEAEDIEDNWDYDEE